MHEEEAVDRDGRRDQAEGVGAGELARRIAEPAEGDVGVVGAAFARKAKVDGGLLKIGRASCRERV